MKIRPHHYIFLVLMLGAATLVACKLGVVDYTWSELFTQPIVLNLRLPRILTSLLVGAALAVSGAVYQSVFRNPLTDPYVLGISSGASLGATIAILVGFSALRWGIGFCALVGALITVIIIYRIASIGNRLHSTTLLLTGVCITFLITAIVSFLMILHQDKMDQIIFWTMGSFANSAWADVAILAPIVVIGIIVVLYYGRDLNLLLSGSETAQSLGVDVERVKRCLLLVTSLMVAFAVSVSGVIGFVGLIVPHCVRLVCGSDNRTIVPVSIFIGALFMLLCDTLARTIMMPNDLPVGSLTALIGAPLFISLLYRNKKQY